MNIRPLHDRVIVKRIEPEKVTASGIVIPDIAFEKPEYGEIMAIGNGKVGDDGKLQSMNVQVGDQILFGKYAGSIFKYDGMEYLTMREEDIVGVVQPLGA